MRGGTSLRGRAPTPQGHASGICPEGSDRSNGSGVAGAGKAGPVWGAGAPRTAGTTPERSAALRVAGLWYRRSRPQNGPDAQAPVRGQGRGSAVEVGSSPQPLGDLGPKIRRLEDLHVGPPRQDPEADLDGPGNRRAPDEAAVRLALELLARVPGGLGHAGRDRGREVEY